MTRLLLAGLHLLALGIGVGAVWARGRALTGRLDGGTLVRLFLADGFWGVAAGLWIGTGLWRLLAGLEKDTAYYFHNHHAAAEHVSRRRGGLAAGLVMNVIDAITNARR